MEVSPLFLEDVFYFFACRPLLCFEFCLDDLISIYLSKIQF